MVKNHCLAYSISDASWRIFFDWLEFEWLKLESPAIISDLAVGECQFCDSHFSLKFRGKHQRQGRKSLNKWLKLEEYNSNSN